MAKLAEESGSMDSVEVSK